MKTWNTPLGARENCPNFDPCPLCFGCRNYASYVVRCEKCREDNQKENICKTELHTEKALAMMISKSGKVEIGGKE